MSNEELKKEGSISVEAENIFPVIKKWLYSEKEIFLREIVSNACDAVTKMKRLASLGEREEQEGEHFRVDVVLDKENKTLSVMDNGVGMTHEEVDRYICNIALSGAMEFMEKYEKDAAQNGIIGHFGLGFYSAFMVSERVEVLTRSYKGGETTLWVCDENGNYSYEKPEMKREGGTDVILHLSEEGTEFLDGNRILEILEKYCAFMPVEIYVSRANTPETQTILASEKLDSDHVIEEVKKEKEEDPDKLKITKRPELINDTHPLWTKNPSECTKEEYVDFYRKVFMDYKEPLFWIHLNMDYPFNLKGILYFPKINMEYESIEGVIKLYNNQVFIADNIKEVIPEFLLLLKGVIDCPDLPLNVSRSALQNDGFVKKISDYITKKVADKLSGMCKTQKEEYEKYWDDIAPFIKFGCLKDEKFCEKMTDYILFKNLDGKYMTLPECLEVNKTDPDETQEGAVDENGEKVEAEVVEDKNEDSAEEEKKDKTIYYVTDEKQQSQYINMFKAAKMDAVMLTDRIDQPFISQLEAKNEGIHFARIDADLTDAFKAKTSKKTQEELNAQAEKVEKLVQKALKNDKIKVKIEKLKNKKVSSVLTVSEESRRMQDMMKMYGGGMDMSMFGAEGETLVLNANHPLVTYITEHEDDANTQMICEQLYDLAKLQNAPLSPEAMTKFVARSNDIMLLLAK